jgi:hypothetical protein
MPFVFQIRPVTPDEGFDLSCQGIFASEVRHRRLIDAVVQAAQLGRDLNGEIHIYDCDGRVTEVLPLPSRAPAMYAAVCETSR